jgi:hypothetical protein
MSKANRFISNTVYHLKRSYGQPVALYIRGVVSQDPSTGEVTYPERKWKIKKAPVLTAELMRKFQYDLSFIAANKNFTYGGMFDKSQRGIIVDTRDLPSDYVQSLDDAFVIDHRRYAIKSIDEFEQARSLIYLVEELKNKRINEIYDRIDHMPFIETVAAVISYLEGYGKDKLVFIEAPGGAL